MRRYETYKDSGVQWMGEIPSHWSMERNKVLLSCVDERVGTCKDFELLSLTTKGIIKRDVESGKGKFPKDFETYKVVKPGHLVMCLFDVDETPRTVGLSDEKGMITGAYDVFEFSDLVIPDYLCYQYLAADNIKALRPHYTGLRKVVKLPRFFQIKSIVPPLSEQQHIVAFLDAKIAKIDEYIAKKEAEIESLKEWKKAFIAHVVTKGLNPQAKMKDSAVSWIGEVPEHWSIDKLGLHFKQRNEKVSDKEYPPLSVSKDGVTPQLESAVKTDNGDNRKKVCKGDFVVNSRSDRKGSCGFSDYDGSVSLISIVITPIDLYDRYYHYLFRSNNYIEEFYRLGRGIVADLWTTRFIEMRNIMIPIPPLDEQKEIVDYIDAATTKADKMIVELSYHVEHMKEYKQRLISDVVTGKINVQPA